MDLRNTDLSNYELEEPEKLFSFNKIKFLYENCDTVIINGEVIGNSIEDKITRFALKLPDRNGKSNIETLEFDYKIGGIEFNEKDFINREIETLESVYNKLFEKINNQYLKNLNGTAPILYLPKRKEIYLNYLNSLIKPPTEEVSEKAIKSLPDYFRNLSHTEDFLLKFNKEFPFASGKELAGLMVLMEKEKILTVLNRQHTAFIRAYLNHYGINENEKSFAEAVRRQKEQITAQMMSEKETLRKQINEYLKPLETKLRSILIKD